MSAPSVTFCGHTSDGASSDCSPVSPGGLFAAIAPFTLLPFIIICGVSFYCCLKENDLTSCFWRCPHRSDPGTAARQRQRQGQRQRQPAGNLRGPTPDRAYYEDEAERQQAEDELTAADDGSGATAQAPEQEQGHFSYSNELTRARLSVVQVGRGANTIRGGSMSSGSLRSQSASSTGHSPGRRVTSAGGSSPSRTASNGSAASPPSSSAAVAARMSFYKTPSLSRNSSSNGSPGNNVSARSSFYRAGAGEADVASEATAGAVRSTSAGGVRRRISAVSEPAAEDNGDEPQPPRAPLQPQKPLTPRRSGRSLASLDPSATASLNLGSEAGLGMGMSGPPVVARSSFYPAGSSSVPAPASSGGTGDVDNGSSNDRAAAFDSALARFSSTGSVSSASASASSSSDRPRSRSPLGTSLGVAAAAASFAMVGRGAVAARSQPLQQQQQAQRPQPAHFSAPSHQALAHAPSVSSPQGSMRGRGQQQQRSPTSNSRGPAPYRLSLGPPPQLPQQHE